MTFQTYNLNIPDAPNDPSVDQPNMQTNTNSIPAIIAIDHFAFGDNNGGRHKQTQLVSQAVVPTGLMSGEGTLYVKQAVGASAVNESQLFYTPDSPMVPKEYQMTRCVNAAAALFGTSTNNYNGVGIKYTGGFTFLPGGLFMQYGAYNRANTGPLENSGTVTFPVPFTSTPFSVQLTFTTKTGFAISNHTIAVPYDTLGNTSFGWELEGSSSASSFVGFYWVAIGK